MGPAVRLSGKPICTIKAPTKNLRDGLSCVSLRKSPFPLRFIKSHLNPNKGKHGHTQRAGWMRPLPPLSVSLELRFS